MFTGIIEEVGTVDRIQKGARSAKIFIRGKVVLEGLKLGDSISVNGVCLTVTGFDGTGFNADIMQETLSRSSLGRLHSSSLVNLERAMAADGRFGGHIVSGHIDGVGVIRSIVRDDNAYWFKIRTTPQILRYIIEKGSIAIDGISLTVAEVTGDDFSVSVIPHTMERTTFNTKKVGDTLNLENDCIGKYVEKLLKNN
jgi:riboflavin synthase